MVVYTAGYAWSVSHTDSADEILKGYLIVRGVAFPLEGPHLGGAVHLGPAWFYLVAVPLLIKPDWMLVALFVGLVCSSKFPLAYYCGRRFVGREFGMLWAAAIAVPGWSTVEQLVFMNANAVAAAALAVVALALRADRVDAGRVTFFSLGLMFSISVHAHPTSIPVGLAIALVFARRVKRSQRLAGLLAITGLGSFVPFLPYVISQIINGFPDWYGARDYLSHQIILSNVTNVPRILVGYAVGGPRMVAEFVFDWTRSAVVAFSAILVIALLSSLAALTRAEGRRQFAAVAATVLIFAAWVACLRPITPVYFTWILTPVIAALPALGLTTLSRLPSLPHLGRVGVVACIALSIYTAFQVALRVREGEGNLPLTVLDVKGSLGEKAIRDVWFPAYAHTTLGKLLCSRRPASLHGHLASIIDRDLSLDTLLECDDRSGITLGSGSGSHLVGMTRAFWAKVSGEPACWIGSMGLSDSVRPLILGRPGLLPATGDRYLPRLASAKEPSLVELNLSITPGRLLLVSNMLDGYEYFELISARIDSIPMEPLASNAQSALFQSPRADRTASTLVVRLLATDLESVDIVEIEPSPAPGARCGTNVTQ